MGDYLRQKPNEDFAFTFYSHVPGESLGAAALRASRSERRRRPKPNEFTHTVVSGALGLFWGVGKLETTCTEFQHPVLNFGNLLRSLGLANAAILVLGALAYLFPLQNADRRRQTSDRRRTTPTSCAPPTSPPPIASSGRQRPYEAYS